MASLMRVKTTVTLLLATMALLAGLALLQRPAEAPDVRFATLDGQWFSTADLRGKVVLVTFWGTYCGPCLKEMPRIIEAHRKFSPRGYETVAVAVRHDEEAKVAAFARERALPFKVVFDASGDIAREFGKVRLTPTVFVLDGNGRVLMKAAGAIDWARLHATVEEAL
jgi:peroxiredoxin